MMASNNRKKQEEKHEEERRQSSGPNRRERWQAKAVLSREEDMRRKVANPIGQIGASGGK